MPADSEKPLEVTINRQLRRTEAVASGSDASKLNGMIGKTYRITSMFPDRIFLANVDATRAEIEGVISLSRLRITPSQFELVPFG